MKRFPESGEPIDLDVGAGLSIDASRVPKDLQPLIPLVNLWAFTHLADQDAFVEHMHEHRPAEIDALNAAFDVKTRDRVREWSSTLPFDGPVDTFTAADWEHPYWRFLEVIKLCETTGGHETVGVHDEDADFPDTLMRLRTERRESRFHEAVIEADAAFRAGDYARYIDLLREFPDLLTKTQHKKLAIAHRRVPS